MLLYNTMNPYLEKVANLANPNKYTKYYCLIIENALTRPQDRKHLKEVFGYVESHHILPESFELGGEKDKQNLVFLTAKEHFIVHLCATKMFDSLLKQKMIFAFRQLRAKNHYQDGRHMNARLYSLIKPNFKTYVRLYNKEKRVMLHESKIEEISKLENLGWSRVMTQEYKDSSMKCMKGKKHSDETKAKMSASQRGIPKLSLRGRSHSPERIQKQRATAQKNKIENPEKYQKSIEIRTLKIKKKYKSGELSMSGENNGMFGKQHTEETKQKIREKVTARAEAIRNDPVKRAERAERGRIASTQSWLSDGCEERRKRISMTSSTAYQKYGMPPQEFYDQKIKPLIYLGFLPAAIIRYKLVDMTKGNIKLQIKKFGSAEDMKQFNLNRKNGAGANKAYIKFQEDQYKKHFAEKIESIPQKP